MSQKPRKRAVPVTEPDIEHEMSVDLASHIKTAGSDHDIRIELLSNSVCYFDSDLLESDEEKVIRVSFPKRGYATISYPSYFNPEDVSAIEILMSRKRIGHQGTGGIACLAYSGGEILTSLDRKKQTKLLFRKGSTSFRETPTGKKWDRKTHVTFRTKRRELKDVLKRIRSLKDGYGEDIAVECDGVRYGTEKFGGFHYAGSGKLGIGYSTDNRWNIVAFWMENQDITGEVKIPDPKWFNMQRTGINSESRWLFDMWLKKCIKEAYVDTKPSFVRIAGDLLRKVGVDARDPERYTLKELKNALAAVQAYLRIKFVVPKLLKFSLSDAIAEDLDKFSSNWRSKINRMCGLAYTRTPDGDLKSNGKRVSFVQAEKLGNWVKPDFLHAIGGPKPWFIWTEMGNPFHADTMHDLKQRAKNEFRKMSPKRFGMTFADEASIDVETEEKEETKSIVEENDDEEKTNVFIYEEDDKEENEEEKDKNEEQKTIEEIFGDSIAGTVKIEKISEVPFVVAEDEILPDPDERKFDEWIRLAATIKRMLILITKKIKYSKQIRFRYAIDTNHRERMQKVGNKKQADARAYQHADVIAICANETMKRQKKTKLIFPRTVKALRKSQVLDGITDILVHEIGHLFYANHDHDANYSYFCDGLRMWIDRKFIRAEAVKAITAKRSQHLKFLRGEIQNFD